MGRIDCARALQAHRPHWLPSSIDNLADVANGEAFTGITEKCINGTHSHYFYELNFHPYMYENLRNPWPDCINEDTTAIAEPNNGWQSDLCKVRQRLLERHGTLRRNSDYLGGGFTREFKDSITVGLCVPAACEGDSVLSLVLPAFIAQRKNRVLPSTHCCARMLGYHYRAPTSDGENIVSHIVERRVHFFQPLNRNLLSTLWVPMHGTVVKAEQTACVAKFTSFEEWYGRLFGASLRTRVVRYAGFERLWQRVTEPGWQMLERQTLQDHSECVKTGNRYVAVQVHVAHKAAGVGSNQREEDDPWGMCVPIECDDESVRSALVPLEIGFSTIDKTIGVTVEEVSSWQAVPVNFVIVGFAKCGTSTIAASLHAHPQIALSNCEVGECENALWSAELALDALPLKSRIHKVMDDFGNAAKPCKTGMIRGMKDSRAIETDRALRQIIAIQGVRAVAVLRDPIDALESHYNDMECWRIRSISEMVRYGLTDCIEGVSENRGWGVWSQRLDWLRAKMPKGSVFIVHLETLVRPSSEQQQSWRKLLSFLGVSEALAGPPIEVRNQRQTPRGLDLCSPEHKEVLETLRAQYADEYPRLARILRASGSPVPESFEQRLTRCDRMHETL